MKLSSILSAGAASIFAVAGMAQAQSAQPLPAEQQKPPVAAQPATDASSYGGAPYTRTQMSRSSPRPCRTDPQCNIFFGR